MNSKHVLKSIGLNTQVLVVSAALVLAPSFARPDGLPYETGFEPPTYSLDELDGQDGWTTFTSLEASVISSKKPKSGLQSIEILGELLGGSGGFVGSTNRRRFEYDGYELGTPVVEIVVDAQLEGEDIGEDLVSTNLVPFVPGWYLGSSMLLSSSGDVWVCAHDPEDEVYSCNPTVSVDLGVYHRLGIRTDFETRMSQFFVNGDLVAKFPIGPWVPSDLFFRGLFLELLAVNDPDLIDPSAYTAYHDNLSVRAYMPVPFDIKPSSCPNPLNVKPRGVLPVAILGTETFDVSEIDPASIRLVPAQGGEGISPLRWSMETEDVATPYEPYTGKESAYDCNEIGPDGYMDLTLKFDKEEVVAELGIVNDQEIKLFTVSGKLKEKFGNTPIIGEDIVLVR